VITARAFAGKHYAVYGLARSGLATVAALLASGAKVDGAAPDGRTALMMAAMFNRSSMLELMLAHGGDPHARNAKGLSARELALTMGAPETARQLEALGA